MSRVMIFVDGPNIGQGIDFVRLAERLVHGRKLEAVFIYDRDEKRELARYPELESLFRIKFIRVPRSRTKTDRVDIQMSVDLVDHAHRDNFDIAVLVTGDGDFRPAIEKVWALGKEVEVAGFANSLGSELKALSRAIVLDAWIKDIRIR